VIIGCVVSLLIASGCSWVDDEESPTETAAFTEPAAEQTARSEEALDGSKRPGKADADDPSTCSQHDDCPALTNTAHWCSPQGICRYVCAPGYGDINDEANQDGCKCGLSNGGREVCDGVDDDCDGVVDNPFAGGQIAAGYRHTCAVDASGAAHCWGKLGGGAQTMQTAARSGIEAFWDVGAGSHHSCALTKEGAVYCWGDNEYGQVGPHAGRAAEEPVRLSEELRFIDIAVGAEHTCALTYDSAVYCWGANDHGQLGDGTLDERSEPVRVDSNTQDFVDVTAGGFHTCAAKATGEVLCWGANILGQAGQEEVDDVLTPTAVDAPEALIFVEAGANHTCGVTGAGLAYCWGNNSYGQLGDETRISTHEPEQVIADVEFLALSAGTTHTCAIAQDGHLYCWGSNADGQLGADGPSASTRPRPVSSELAFSDLAAGGGHTCALSRDGHLYCWGDSRYGQLAPGQMASTRVPSRSDCQ
jgi:alpha-tubulin suppressor-like RCC1 family protein